MFDIYLYINSSENNRVDKRGYLTLISSYSGSLKDNTSIISPSIIIDSRYVRGVSENSRPIGAFGRSIGTDSQYSFIKANYAYIPEFERYYFITDIVNVSDNLWQFSMEIDALMTYRVQLMDLECFVSRNEFEFSDNLPDDRLPVEMGHKVEYLSNTQQSLLFYDYREMSLDTYCVVVQVANDAYRDLYAQGGNKGVNNLSNFNRCFIMTLRQFNNFSYQLSSFNIQFLFSNPTDSLISFKIYPFNIYSKLKSGYYSDLYVGLSDGSPVPIGNSSLIITGHVYELLRSQTFDFEFLPISKHSTGITAQLYHEKYSTYKVYIPYYGFIDIDADDFINYSYYNSQLSVNLSIYIKFSIDIISGLCRAVLYKDSGYNFPLQQIEYSIGIDSPIGHSNASDISRNLILSSIKTVASITAASATGGASLAAGAAMDYGKEQLSLIETKTKMSILRDASDFTVSALANSKRIISGGVAYGGFYKGISLTAQSDSSIFPFVLVFLPITTLLTSNDVLKYNHLTGRPLNKSRALSALYGYTEIIGCHLDNLVATETEKNKISQLFKEGILLPDPPTT